MITWEHAAIVTVVLLHSLGVVSAITALFHTRSSQGAVAWIIGLVAFPYVTLPVYWIFGRNRFHGYVVARRLADRRVRAVHGALASRRPDLATLSPRAADSWHVLERLAEMAGTGGNQARLLINGQATFDAVFEAASQAQSYLLVQYFIIHDDRLGRRLHDVLLERAQAGVRVYLLYDEIGSFKLPGHYLDSLRAVGVHVSSFHTTRGRGNRLQINFRNHRKIVVVDGRVGFVGGHNVGDEYQGLNPKIGPWRDTSARFAGPCVTAVQLSFVEDWHWATGEVPALDWSTHECSQDDCLPTDPLADPQAPAEGYPVLVLPTGPGDVLDTCTLFFLEAIHSARQRLWIVSPYFVPDAEITAALELAALRGVDVRVMLPHKPDHKLVWLASFSYLTQLEGVGVRFYRYGQGFLHQKILLVDDTLASVGTVNADNRSLRLNFEISMIVPHPHFVAQVEAMLENDFAQCHPATADEYRGRWFGFRAAVQAARLLSPIL